MNPTLKGLFLLIVLLGTTGIVSAEDETQVERGMQVYADQKCSVCHAIAGKGNAKGALDNVGSRLKADEIREWIINPVEMTKKSKAGRKPSMKASPNLSKEDVDALVAYMASLKEQ